MVQFIYVFFQYLPSSTDVLSKPGITPCSSPVSGSGFPQGKGPQLRKLHPQAWRAMPRELGQGKIRGFPDDRDPEHSWLSTIYPQMCKAAQNAGETVQNRSSHRGAELLCSAPATASASIPRLVLLKSAAANQLGGDSGASRL